MKGSYDAHVKRPVEVFLSFLIMGWFSYLRGWGEGIWFVILICSFFSRGSPRVTAILSHITSVRKRVKLSFSFVFCSKFFSPLPSFPKERQTNCRCWLFDIHIIPCIFPRAPRSTAHLLGCYLSGGSALPAWLAVCSGYPGCSKTNINWWHWILCSVSAVSPRHAFSVATPSSLQSEISSDRSRSTEPPGYHLSSQQIGSCNTRQTWRVILTLRTWLEPTCVELSAWLESWEIERMTCH